MKIKRPKPTVAPNLGLYLGVPTAMIPPQGMAACKNVRIKNQRVVRDNLGWKSFNGIELGAPVTLIDNFVGRDRITRPIFGSTTDLFTYDEDSQEVYFLTPRYEEGTVAVVDESDVITGDGTTWSTNVRQGDPISLEGSGDVFPSSQWYEVASVDSDTQITLTSPYSGPSDPTAGYTVRRVFAGDIQHPFFTETFYGGFGFQDGSGDDRWYATNGIDPVVAWDGDADQVYIPTLGDVSTCAYLRKNKNAMIYVAPVASGENRSFSIRVSSIGEPENVVSGDASEFIVHDRADPLIAAEMLGELLAIYGEKSITLAQYVGAPLIYIFRTIVTGFGPLGSRAITPFPDYHMFVGNDAQYAFDGARAVPVNNHVWRDILRRTTPARLPLIQAYRYEEQGEVLWVMPLTSDPDPEEGQPFSAYVHHYLEDVGERAPDPFTYRDLPATAIGPYIRDNALQWDDLDEPWETVNFRWNDKFLFAKYPQTLFGDENGILWELDGSSLQDGEPPVSFVQFPRIPLGDVSSKGVLVRVYPFVEQAPHSEQTVTVRVYGTDTPDGVATLRRSMDFLLSSEGSAQFVSPRISARYADVQIGTQDGGGYWAIMGYAHEIAGGGSR